MIFVKKYVLLFSGERGSISLIRFSSQLIPRLIWHDTWLILHNVLPIRCRQLKILISHKQNTNVINYDIHQFEDMIKFTRKTQVVAVYVRIKLEIPKSQAIILKYLMVSNFTVNLTPLYMRYTSWDWDQNRLTPSSVDIP